MPANTTNVIQPESDLEVPKSLWWRQWMDSCLSAIALILLSPLLLVIAASIFLETGLPIVFSQRRVGRNGRIFCLLKFRTMQHSTSGPPLTIGGDRRVTHVGHFLRKFKLDELPQLWNVVCAEMSVVGPRPEVPEFVDLCKPAWQFVLRVRPGITDPASIAFHQEEKLLAKSSDPIRYYRETLLPAKLAMNIAYLRERSLWLDLQVVLRTVFCAAFPGKLDTQQATLLVPEDPK
jgi:lipopolysaccharide/colanic/teichoic acid biosynthesis glycosyltransferase